MYAGVPAARAKARRRRHVPVKMFSFDEFLANKREAGRPRDLAYVKALERVKAR